MTEQIIPSTSPVNTEQGPGSAQQPQTNSPAATQPEGTKEITLPDGTKMSSKEFEILKRKAGNWDLRGKPNNKEDRQSRRDSFRESKTSGDGDGDDPGVIARDQEIRRLSTENEQLRLKDNVKEILTRDEYKDIPKNIKKLISDRPFGFIAETSRTLNDKAMDIEDFLDDFLDEMASSGSDGIVSKGNPKIEEKPVGNQIPPANGSGPQSPNGSPDIDLRGKTGQARSTSILANLFKSIKQ